MRICDGDVLQGSWRPTFMWMLWVLADDWRPVTKGEVWRGFVSVRESVRVGEMKSDASGRKRACVFGGLVSLGFEVGRDGV